MLFEKQMLPRYVVPREAPISSASLQAQGGGGSSQRLS